LYSSNMSNIDVIFSSFAICVTCFVICPSVSCSASHVFHLCCCYYSGETSANLRCLHAV
jgi:hypothetical protein